MIDKPNIFQIQIFSCTADSRQRTFNSNIVILRKLDQKFKSYIPLLPSVTDLVPQKHGGEKTTRHLKMSHPI
jgi:hypothetical protein